MKPEIFAPTSELADFVMCYWNLESSRENTPQKNTIVPDGTMKLIFHYGDTHRHHRNHKESIVLPKCFLIGQLTKPYVVEPLGITGSFVARFHPNGFLPFTTLPIKDMENTAVPLKDLFGKEGEMLGENILNAKHTLERIRFIEYFLLHRLQDKKHIDRLIQSTVETILETKGKFSVTAHATQIRINRRQLTRKFSSAIGLSPKQLAKTIRIQATLKKLLTQEVPRLTDLAYENDYFDQAHFIKDFKEFTGITPKEFYGDHLKMSLIFDRKK
jgi:AraC-like DNA-binding protein